MSRTNVHVPKRATRSTRCDGAGPIHSSYGGPVLCRSTSPTGLRDVYTWLPFSCSSLAIHAFVRSMSSSPSHVKPGRWSRQGKGALPRARAAAASPGRPLRPGFESFPWRKDSEMLAAWQKGQTGYPIVDAGMRQLAESGWMHNRVRMITASFLVKDLLIDWRRGERVEATAPTFVSAHNERRGRG